MVECEDRCVERVAANLMMPFTVGGGVSTIEHVRRLLGRGADKVSVNTAAVNRPELVEEIARECGSQCCVLAVDAKRKEEGEGWQVLTHGGRKPTGKDALKWAKEAVERGAGEILLTSMDRDGTQDGYDLELTAAISRMVRLPVIASGGAGNARHLYEALTAGGAEAALAASIFHFGELSIGQVKEELAARGLEVRR